MYHTPVMRATSDSRTAGPVCSTREAMRPAKSFWKNAQDWRATCQWFCHRIMLETLAEIAWLATRFWPVCASGRTTSSTAAIASRVRHHPPHEDRDHGIQQGDQEARGEQRNKQAFGLAGKMPIERRQPGGRFRPRR